LTQKELALRAGTTQQVIQHIEKGVILKPRNIEALSRALDASPAWLQFGVEAIDKLDADAIELAQVWQVLPEPQKTAMKTAIENMAPPSKKPHKNR